MYQKQNSEIQSLRGSVQVISRCLGKESKGTTVAHKARPQATASEDPRSDRRLVETPATHHCESPHPRCFESNRNLRLEDNHLKSLILMGHTNKAATRCKDRQPLRIDHDFLTGGDPYTEDAISFDEAGFNNTMAPRRGWSTKGTRVAKPAHSKGHGNNLSLLLAIDRNGVVASKIVKGGVIGTTVTRFFETLPPNRPIILDNYGIHKTDAVRQVCEARNLTLRFTTPYSPWYNPVERLCEWKRLVSKNFRNDIRTSVREIKNFPGLFRASRAEWREDALKARILRSTREEGSPTVHGLKGLWWEHGT